MSENNWADLIKENPLAAALVVGFGFFSAAIVMLGRKDGQAKLVVVHAVSSANGRGSCGCTNSVIVGFILH